MLNFNLNSKLIENDPEVKSNSKLSYDKQKLTRIRWLILILSFFGIMCAYITRLNLSLTIVEMTKVINSTTKNLNKNDKNNYQTDTTNFDWDAPTQGLILGSFFYTYGFLQVPGARWAEKFGAKLICLTIIFVSGLLSLIIPFAAKLGVISMIITRTLLGLAQSAIYPSYYALISKWFPEEEQSRALAWLSNGAFCGTIFTMAFSGFLCEHKWFGGWPAVFYFSGLLCLCWCVAWFWLSASEPRLHSMINKYEVTYIEKDKSSLKNLYNDSIPWKKILMSKQVWAVIVVKFGIDWVFWLIMLNLPQFLHNVLHFRIYQNGLINCSLNIVLIVSNTLGGYLSDKLISSKIMNKTKLRKSFETFSVLGTSLCLILVPEINQQSSISFIYVFLSLMFLFGFNVGGDVPIVIDMTEHYPATVFAIANGICSGCGFLAPLVTGLILGKDINSFQNWSYVFYFSAFINLMCLIIFLIYGSAEPLFSTEDEEFKKAFSQRMNLLETQNEDEDNFFIERGKYEIQNLPSHLE